ncbi:MAG: hypothetical protein ABJA81_04975 [Nocardioidaceae bacterium]
MFPTVEPFIAAEDAYHRERISSYFASAAIRRRLRADRRARSHPRRTNHVFRATQRAGRVT